MTDKTILYNELNSQTGLLSRGIEDGINLKVLLKLTSGIHDFIEEEINKEDEALKNNGILD